MTLSPDRMTVWKTVGGHLHRRATCSGGPGHAGVRSGQQRLVRVTRAEFEATERCRCMGEWKADADRSVMDLKHAKHLSRSRAWVSS